MEQPYDTSLYPLLLVLLYICLQRLLHLLTLLLCYIGICPLTPAAGTISTWRILAIRYAAVPPTNAVPMGTITNGYASSTLPHS